MLDSRKEATDALARAMSDALTNGLTTDDIDEIAQMVAAQQPLALDYSAQHVAAPVNGANGLPIYTEIPDGLIDLAGAAVKFGCNVHRLRAWVRRGHIPIHGRLRGGAPGGGYFVVAEADIQHRLSTVGAKGGRPRKKLPQKSQPVA